MITLLSLSLALAHPGAPDEPAGDTGSAPAGWKVDDPHGPSHPVKLDLREGTWMSVDVHGDRLVFDLLGDLWTIPAAGGEATRLTSGAAWDAQPRFSPDGKRIAYVSDAGGNEQIWLMNADGTGAHQLTAEKEARLTEPVWDPTGPYLLARRRTIDTRSIGVTELWQFHLEGGKGIQLTKLDQHPHAAEAVADGRWLYFATRRGRFEYNHDPMSGLWQIVRMDRRTGEILPIVGGAGGAARPTLSPDGKQLAFVSRDRNQAVLEVVDLQTGRRRVLADWLDRDEMEGFALHGVYPAMDWSADGIVLWAGGKLWRVGLDGAKAEIPFHAVGEWAFRDVERWERTIPDEVQARVLRWPAWGPNGEVAFSALGALWLRDAAGKLTRVSEGTGYAPSWSPDGTKLAWTSWDDEAGGRLHVSTVKKGKLTTETLPVEGQLVNPAWGEDGAIVVLRGVSGFTGPDLGDVPFFEILLLEPGKKAWTSRVVTSTANRGSASRASKLYLHEGRVWWMKDLPPEGRTPSKAALVSVTLDGLDERQHLVFANAEEVAISPDFSRVAYKSGHNAYVTALPRYASGVGVDEAVPTNRLTKVVGDWLGWTPDGKAVTWSEGPILAKKALEGVGMPPYDAPKLDKPDYDVGVERTTIDLRVPRDKPSGSIALVHARVVTMNGDEVIEDATVVIHGDRIASVTKGGAPPPGARVIDLTGKTVIPGLVDVHAHLHYTAGDVLPEQEWRYLTNLDYGVTTVHDPSASTDLVFTQSERVEAGFMDGPRVYSTGFILYGALNNLGAPTPDADEALNHVRRLKAFGAQSVKVYQQSQRERRQWYAQACYAEQVLCVPEGGGDLFMDLGMVQDGYHAIEHSLPSSPLYADVIGWMAGSRGTSAFGTAYTPTLLVAYGGLQGENWFYQFENPIDDERLRRHYPTRELEAQAFRRSIHAQDTAWNHASVARDAARMSREGVLVTLGAHGQLQGLGAHWELWALASEGAMTPHEALRAGTLNGAIYLGLDEQLGSVEAGKLADLVVLDADPLQDIRRSDDIAFVIKNGEIFE